MSKSRGNVINPDEYVQKYGADTLRMYLVFMGPMDGYPDFRDSGIEGMGRFISKLWNLFRGIKKEEKDDPDITTKMHQTIKKVTTDVGTFNYNTAIAAIMEYVNLIKEKENYSANYLEPLVKMIAPFAPHLAEEIWHTVFKKKGSVHISDWPTYDEKYLISDKVKIIVQVNGKLRGTYFIPAERSTDQKYVVEDVKNRSEIKNWLKGQVKKEIFVPGKLVNFVI
jgi:leucyl-tRNA synthetase